MRKWIVRFLASLSGNHTFRTRNAALELFFHDGHFTMDTLSLRTCLVYSQHLDTLEVIFRNSPKHFKDLSALARIGLGAETFNSRDSAAVYVAKFELSIPELAVVQFPEPVGGSALHHIVDAFGELMFGDVDVEEWSQLGVEIIRNGADLFSVKKRAGLHDVTPFLSILQRSSLGDSPFSRTRRRLLRWTDMLRRANVDLEWYCAKEVETWQTLDLDLTLWPHRSFTCTTRLVKLKFCPETQSCIPVFVDDGVVQLMRQRFTPGSFVGSQYPIDTICWESLSKEEKEEGHWSRFGNRLLIRSSSAYDFDPQQEPCSWYNKLIDCTKDDNGTLLQMTRCSRKGNRSSKRASSQPPSQHRTRHDDQLLFSSRTHTWLPPYHYCHVRCTWTVNCHHGPVNWRMDYRMSKESRLCVYQDDNDDIENYPEDTNFLGEIRQCKSLQHRFGDPLHPILRHSHEIGCPRGCDQVDLEKLAKPRDLQRWHPCRDEL